MGRLATAQNSPAPLKYIDFVLTPSAKDWHYAVGKPATVEVQVLRFGVPLENVTVNYEIGPEMLPADKKSTVTLKNGVGKIDLGTSKTPGFRQLTVKTDYQGRSYSNQIKVAYAPEKIISTVTLPPDFTQFWDKAKAEVTKIPMDARLTLLPEHSTPTVKVYLVNLQNYKKGQRLFSYLAKPKAPGNLLSPRYQATTNTPEKLKTIGYYDGVNFARQLTVPGFYSWGYNNNTCPPTSVYAAVNAIKAPKTLAITPITGHWRFEETNQESITWLKQQVQKPE